jgi:hypothetical protein
MTNLIVYQNDGETLITTVEREPEFLDEWFGPGTGRFVAEFDRTETADVAILVSANVTATPYPVK